jgi:molybdopterin-containing oxidoreductase family membrane subunit
MAPLFVASALVSGLALVILLALVLRAVGRLRFDDDLVAYLGGLLGVFIAVEAFFVLSEMLTAAYPAAPFEGDPVYRLLFGQFAPLFWFEVIVGLGLPFALLARRSLRARPLVVAAASAIAIVGIYGLAYPPIGLPPGVSVGTAPDAGSSAFQMSLWYVPSVVEALVTIGVLAFGGLIFSLAVLVLPLQEPPGKG